jgi:hypothetical protein
LYILIFRFFDMQLLSVMCKNVIDRTCNI